MCLGSVLLAKIALEQADLIGGDMFRMFIPMMLKMISFTRSTFFTHVGTIIVLVVNAYFDKPPFSSGSSAFYCSDKRLLPLLCVNVLQRKHSAFFMLNKVLPCILSSVSMHSKMFRYNKWCLHNQKI